jgi:hypothetical protein
MLQCTITQHNNNKKLNLILYIISCEQINAFPCSSKCEKIALSALTIFIISKVLASAVKQEKEIKSYTPERKK